MNLSILDRLTLIEVLPKQGDMITLSIVTDIIEKIKFTQDDITKYGIVVTQMGENTNYQWDETKKEEKKATFTETETNIIKDAFMRLDKEKKMTLRMMPTAKKYLL